MSMTLGRYPTQFGGLLADKQAHACLPVWGAAMSKRASSTRSISKSTENSLLHTIHNWSRERVHTSPAEETSQEKSKERARYRAAGGAMSAAVGAAGTSVAVAAEGASLVATATAVVAAAGISHDNHSIFVAAVNDAGGETGAADERIVVAIAVVAAATDAAAVDAVG